MPASPPAKPAASDTDSASQTDAHVRQEIGENFPDGALFQCTLAIDGRQWLTHLGRSAVRLFGELPTTLPADISWLSDRIHPSDSPQTAAVGGYPYRDSAPGGCDVRVRARDGSIRWVNIRTHPRIGHDGSIVLDGAIVDVTERRRAEEIVRRQAEFGAALNAATRELLRHRTLGELLPPLAERAAALLRSPHAEIALIEGDNLVVKAFARGGDFLGGDRVNRHERAVSWRAVETRAPVVVPHYTEDPDRRELYRDRDIDSAAVLPIVIDGRCVGVIGLGRPAAAGPFTPEDVNEGTLFAQLAAGLVQNASTHEEAARGSEADSAAVRESEALFHAVFERSPIMIGLVSLPDGRIVELNQAILTTFGYTREEAIGRTTGDLGLWVHAGQREAYLAQLTKEGSVAHFEAEMRKKNGEVITAVHSGILIAHGDHRYNLSSLQDITAAKQAEVSRARTLALMRATFESTADGILVVNAEGRIETYNRNFAEMWGLPAEYEPGDAAESRLIHTVLGQLAAPELFLGGVREVYSESEDELFDVLHAVDGRVFERFSRPQLLAGRPTGRVWSFRDITEQRRAEAALRQSEERFRALAEVSPVGIFSSDPTGRTVFVNRRWCELAGISPDEALGEGWMRVLHPDDRAHVASLWAEAVRLGESSAAEFRFVRPDGSIRWLVGQSRAQHNPDGSLAGYVGTITDVTHLKLAEEERSRVEARQRQSQKMEALGTLAGGIAHDFNNILTGMFGFLELARSGLPTTHPVQPWLERIGTSSERARDLIRQILTFSRKSAGSRSPVHLHLVVSEALRLLQSTLPPTVAIEARVAPETPPVLADSTQIHQVVVNLCTNAWHAMPPRGGRIVVALERCTVTPEQVAAQPDLRAGDWVRLTVTDDGSGMDAATLEHIFEPFFTTKETGGGTGLGLAVVHGIVRSHEGVILARSAVGEGSTFEIYFPAIQEEALPPAQPKRELPRGRGERIMVVDDDEVSGFAIEMMIDLLGYSVKRHTRPEDALADVAASPDHYDLVVSDLAMPGMSGAELIEHLVRIRPGLPVIIVTGFIDPERQRTLEQTYARAVLHKPLAREELARTIAAHVRTSR